MSINCLFVDTLCRHVHQVDMNEQTQAAVKLDQVNPACLRRAARPPVHRTQTGGRQVEANLKEHGHGG